MTQYTRNTRLAIVQQRRLQVEAKGLETHRQNLLPGPHRRIEVLGRPVSSHRPAEKRFAILSSQRKFDWKTLGDPPVEHWKQNELPHHERSQNKTAGSFKESRS